jgi:hypothetical protein
MQPLPQVAGATVQARGQSFEAGAIPGYVRTGLIVRNEHRLWQCRTDGREIRRIQETGERRKEKGESLECTPPTGQLT